MENWILDHYLWVKALHIVAVISWMAAMLYLPRLFVYHAGVSVGSDMSETFKIMERRLLKYIATPAMIASWVLGLMMLWANPDLMQQGWIHVKLTLVFLLSGFHGAMAGWTRKFANDANTKSPRFYRFANEIPTILMIAIVILAVVKPF